MSFFLPAAFFVLGAVIASFVGVVVARLGTGQSFLTGRSRCDACDKPLSFFSLIPVLSYFAAKGRAQCCGAKISCIAPLTETVLGAVFVFAYLMLGVGYTLPCMLVSLSLLLALVEYDLAHQILPATLLYPFVAASAVTGFLSSASLSDFYGTLLTAACIAGSLAAIHVVSGGRAMGLADAPFALALALLTGPVALSGFLFSFWIGAVIGIVLLLGRPRGSRMGVEVPFAPFLAAGFLLAYFTQWNPVTFITILFSR